MARLYLVMIALCFIALYPTMGKKLYLVETKDMAGDYIRDYYKDDNTDYIMSGRKARSNDYNNDQKTDYIISGSRKRKITANSNAMDYGVANPPYRARCKKGWTWNRYLNKCVR